MIAAFTLNVSVDRRYIVSGSRMNAVNRVQKCITTAGGKGLNVARVAHTLGEAVIAGGIVGGFSGQYILQRLDEEGIPHRFTKASAESRSCINIGDLATGTQTEYLEPGAIITREEQARFFEDFDELADQCDVITLSGSLPGGMPEDTYAQLIQRAKAKAKPVLLDASGAALVSAISACPAYIKPNEDEIAALSHCESENEEAIAQAALRLHQEGIDRVVVSLGKRGALMACAQGVFRGQPPQIEARNTVGCGDAMTAAFALAQQRGLDARDSMHLAIAVSCASALHEQTGALYLPDYEMISPKVRVWKL